MKHLFILCVSFLSFALLAQKPQHTIISGKILNNTTTEVNLVHFNQWEWEDIMVQLDKNGLFRFDLLLTEGAQFRIENSENSWDMYYEAGDSVFLTLRVGYEDSLIQASGKGAAQCLWIAENFKWGAKLRKSNSDALPAESALFIDSVYKARLVFLEKYSLLHPEVSEGFKLYYRLEYRYRAYNRKQMLAFAYAANHKIEVDSVPVPKNMFDYMDTIAINVDKYWISDTYQDMVRSVVYHHYRNICEKAKQGGNEKAYSPLESYQLAKMMITGRAKWSTRAEVLNYCFQTMDSLILQEYNSFLAECPNPVIVKRLKASFEEKQIMAKGKNAPNFTAIDLQGKTVSLADFQGHIVMLDFWSSWCGPCLHELSLEKGQKLEEKYAAKGIVFLKVNLDIKEEAWITTLDRLSIRNKGTHIHQAGDFDSPVAKAYGIVGIPTYLILDKKGIIVENVPPRPSDPKLAEILDKLLEKP